ncbi:metal-dependent hydrolase [soil metagenome]
MKITYYGHSCFAVNAGAKTLLFDPFISPNPLADSVDVESVGADYVLLTHGHEDHVADAEAILKRTGATLIANFEVANWFEKRGIAKTHPMNHGGEATFDFGVVKAVSAIHSSSLPDGSYGGNPMGFVISTVDEVFYVSGDTALTYDMKLIDDEFRLDWAALCIGDNFTMGIADAVRAADFVGVRTVLGLHYDTFPPIQIDHGKAKAMFHASEKELVLPAIGSTIDL